MSDIQTTSIQPIENDEITLKELILKAKEYIIEIIRYWYIVLLFIMPIASYMFYEAYKTKATYKADLTFSVNTDQGTSLGLAAALGGLGELGGNTKLDKIIEFSKSRRISQTALFRRAVINNVDDYFANHLIRERELHEGWANDTSGLKGFLFKRDSVERFNRIENGALLKLHDILVGKTPIFTSSYDKKSEVMKLSLTTTNEDLSIGLLKVIYDDLSTYYVAKSTSKEERTYKLFRAKADSLKNLVRSKDMSADRYEDRNRGSLFLEDKREADRLKKEAYIYNTLYGETEKNMTLASFALESKAPFIQEIDMPISPIKGEKKSKKMALITGFLLGGFLGAIIIILRKILRESLA